MTQSSTKNRSAEENFAQLKTYTNKAEARQFLATLSSEDRIKLYSVNTTGLKCGDVLFYPRPYIPDGEEADVPPPTQEHINQLYSSLFAMIKSAHKKAHDNGKIFQIIVGDIHQDRTALSIMAMATHICRRLGISEMGMEQAEQGKLEAFHGVTVTGMKELQEEITNLAPNTILSERDTITSTRQRRNFDFITQLGMQKGMTAFSNDPKAVITQKDMDEIHANPHKRIYEEREPAMRELLAQKATNHKDCISFYGAFHLQALASESPPENIERLFISAANAYIYDSVETYPMPVYNNFTVLPSDPGKAKMMVDGSITGKSPLVQIMVDGSLKSAQAALDMAATADKELGDKLQLGINTAAGRSRG